MRILVTGSRNLRGDQVKRFVEERMLETLQELQHLDAEPPTLIVGDARGIDSIAFAIAARHGWAIHQHNARWDRDGKAAGIIRNQAMLVRGQPHVVIAVWDGQSRGTLDMMTRAAVSGVPVKLFLYR